MARFVVIDGLDGCGKATQVNIIADYLINNGYKVHKISFPKYESNSSALVKMYLNGEFGKDVNNLNPYVCGSFYAVDRFAQFYKEYFKYFEEDDNTFILADRYISANIIHQASKLNTIDERHDYITWAYDYECNLCKLPKEDITILLTVPPIISQSLLSNRYNDDNSKKDIHENNLNYLQNCYDRLEESVQYIKDNDIANWKWIDCSTIDKKSILSINKITSKIIEILKSQFYNL